MRQVYMVLVLLFIHGTFSSSSQISEGEAVENDQLLFAHVIFRHGDRSPLKPYPNDPYKGVEFFPGGFGQVTKVSFICEDTISTFSIALQKRGLQRHLELGKYLRKRYYELLGDGKYAPDKVYVRSSDYDRTIMSAAANLLGFFPTESDQIWTEELPSIGRPIPIHTVPIKFDHIVALERPCALYDKAFEDRLNSNEFKEAKRKVDRYFKIMMEHSGYKNATIGDAYSVWDTLKVHRSENLRLPSWVGDMLEPGSDMDNFFVDGFKMLSNTTEMKKLKSGFLIKEMLERFIQKTQSKLKPDRFTIQIYSAHDITISNFLNSLGLFDSHVPPYASCLLFELYKSRDNFYVKLFYKNTTADNLPPLNIPGCGTKCPINMFYQLFDHIIPKQDFESECNLSLPSMPVKESDVMTWKELIGPIICTFVVFFSTIYGWQSDRFYETT
ncbi:prostatic acid phosphatase-like [Sitodiplosis mosellana]|uniref:prostatic acid phosphatase-like n=1 Tax=Sitodiplosis mosellana TaxID=263140 RepID=UPI0024437DD2|nr:prostatic acid phosphatase-like [Sitodiplosis mosellana]